MMTPTPNLTWRTLWPMRQPAGSIPAVAARGAARGASAAAAAPHSAASTSTARRRAEYHCTSSPGTSSRKRDATW